MTFQPDPNQTIRMDDNEYRFTEHPAAPGVAYGQEGRAGTVYQLQNNQGAALAIKVFKPRFRLPSLVSQAEKIRGFASLPALAVCDRTVITPLRYGSLLRSEPDLLYAVMMPWVDGSTWQEILLGHTPQPAEEALALARRVTHALVVMEEHGISHGDLSGANLIVQRDAVQLVDLEGMYVPGLQQPEALPSGSLGYAHGSMRQGVWSPLSDRFAGAIMLAEILGSVDEEFFTAGWGESYFPPEEMQADGSRVDTLTGILTRRWGAGVASLFQRAWQSASMQECPSFGEWLVSLPDAALRPVELPALPVKPVQEIPPTIEEKPVAPPLTGAVQRLFEAANQKRAAGDHEGANRLYRALLDLPELTGGQRREVEALLGEAAPPPPTPTPVPASPSPRMNWKWLGFIGGGIITLVAVLLLLPRLLPPAVEVPAFTPSDLAPVAAPATVTLAPQATATPLPPTITATLPLPTEDLGPTQTLVAVQTLAAQTGYLAYAFSPSLEFLAFSNGPKLFLSNPNGDQQTPIFTFTNSSGGSKYCSKEFIYPYNPPAALSSNSYFYLKYYINSIKWDPSSKFIGIWTNSSAEYTCKFENGEVIQGAYPYDEVCYIINAKNPSKIQKYVGCHWIKFYDGYAEFIDYSGNPHPLDLSQMN